MFINTDYYIEYELDGTVDVPVVPLYVYSQSSNGRLDDCKPALINGIKTMLTKMGKFHTLSTLICTCI